MSTFSNDQYKMGFLDGFYSTEEWSHTRVTLLSSELQRLGKSVQNTADYIEGFCDGLNKRNEQRSSL